MLAVRPAAVSRYFELLDLHRFPGSADERALSARGRKGHALRPHAQRLWARGRPDAGGGDRELPERGRVGDDPRSVQAVYPRSRPDRAGALMRILLTNDEGYPAPGLKVLEEIGPASCRERGCQKV